MGGYLLLILACLACTANARGPYFFVASPNVIRFENEEVLGIGVAGIPAADVTVRLQVTLGSVVKEIFQGTASVREGDPKTMKFAVRAADIFSEEDIKKPTSVVMEASTNFGARRRAEILLSYDTGYIFVQTDKPIYYPRDRVHIRTLALTEKLQAATNDTVELLVDVIDPTGLIMQRERRKGEGQFFTCDFRMPPNARLGLWTIDASFGGQFSSNKSTTFQVDEYVLPTFGVDVQIEPTFILSGQDHEVRVTVQARYVYGKMVEGNVHIALYCIADGEDDIFILTKDKKVLDHGRAVYVFGRDEMKPTLNDVWFPAGRFLKVVATATEEVTGKQETGVSKATIFTEHAYKFDFSQSRKYYTPGSLYYLKVRVTDATGKPIPEQSIDSSCNGRFSTDDMRTDEDGFQIIPFSLGTEVNSLQCKVFLLNQTIESQAFQVEPYRSPNGNRVRVELDTDHGEPRLQTRSHGNRNTATGLFHLVTVRGTPAAFTYKDVHKGVINIGDLNLTAPSARCTAFYIDTNSDEVVADSIKIHVEQKCRGKGLRLETEDGITSGETTPLVVHGSKWMAVGLKVLDKAVLLRNNKNILRQSSVYRALKSHDLGCGEGGGLNSESVLENAGVTLLTNAQLDPKKRNGVGCDHEKKRKKRSEECAADGSCCSLGTRIAKDLVNQSFDFGGHEMKPLKIKCFWKVTEIMKTHSPPMRCLRAMYRACVDDVTHHFRDSAEERSEWDDENDYLSDLQTAGLSSKSLKVRSRFKESWLFEVLNLDAKGRGEVNLPYPDSITEWMITAIGISQDQGLCIADPVNVTAAKDFFIQLDLPYSAKRLELINVKATIFNYGKPRDDPKEISVYMEGETNVCSNAKPGVESPRKIIVLEPNSAETVRFPIIPLAAGSATAEGQFNIKVTAIDISSGKGDYDVVEKILYVQNEGIKEELVIHLCLGTVEGSRDCESDPNRSKVEYPVLGDADAKVQITTVDLKLPSDAIDGTAYASAHITGSNVFEIVVHELLGDVETWFILPFGCGQQTILTLAPNVYALRYLRLTNQVTPEIEVEGNKNIHYGITREKTFRRHDGSYARFPSHSAAMSSTWLTAYVMRVYCQAAKVVSSVISTTDDINPGLRWLATKQNEDGTFRDVGTSFTWRMRKWEPVAFVLVAMLECRGDHSNLVEESVQKSLLYLGKLEPKDLPLGRLAIITYALSLARTSDVRRFNDELLRRAFRKDDKVFWSDDASGTGTAFAIELTSYALLSQLEMNDLTISAKIVKWLVQQRNSGGAFKSGKDTVVGLQAMSEYNIRTYKPQLDLTVKVSAKGMKQIKTTINNATALVPKHIRKIPVDRRSTKMTVEASGTGTGRMSVTLHYNRRSLKDEICAFDIAELKTKEIDSRDVQIAVASGKECDACGGCKEDKNPDFDYTGIDDILISDAGAGDIPIAAAPRKKRQSENIVDDKKVFCLSFDVSGKGPEDYGMSIIDIGLQTGVSVKKEDLQKLVDEGVIDDYEMPTTGKGFIILYVDEFIAGRSVHITLRLFAEREDKNSMRQSAVITVYDYYNPEKRCYKYYGVGIEQGKPVDFTCDKKNAECVCLQSICAKNVTGKIKTFAKPALSLYKYLCLRADYGVIVTVKDVFIDEQGFKHAHAIVNRVLKKGVQTLFEEDEINFFWREGCFWPKVEVNSKYVIIARDGEIMKDEHQNTVYSYPLMKSALVIKKKARGKLHKAMKWLQGKMKTHGCTA